MEPKQRPPLLCVDDEPAVLEGLTHLLRRRYTMHTATSGADGLAILQREPNIAVILSDMRMPGMNGAEFLAQARKIAPDAVRLLLTGQSNIENAIAAVNQGQIFRFLSKPCPPPLLEVAIDAAAEQYRLITSERVLLEETLRGSVRTLTDVLALTSPLAFGRATRVKQTALELAVALSLPEPWQLEVAAMFSQLGFIALPADVLEKIHYGTALTEAETAMAARAPLLTEQLLANIPRLEGVREILTLSAKPPERRDSLQKPLDDKAKARAKASQILRLAIDLDALEAQGTEMPILLETLRSRADRYDGEVLTALLAARGATQQQEIRVRELPISGLRVGMVVAEDLKMVNGALLVARGFEVTESFVERARNFRPGSVKEPVRVIVKTGAAPSGNNLKAVSAPGLPALGSSAPGATKPGT